jgi:hypothetical protein
MISKGSSDIANPKLGSNGAVSRGAIKRLLKVGLIIILGTSGLGAAVIFIMSLRQIELSGKVVSSNTSQRPRCGATKDHLAHHRRYVLKSG